MIIVLKSNATEKEKVKLIEKIKNLGFEINESTGESRTILGIIGGNVNILSELGIESYPGVEKVIRVLKPYKLVSREFHPEDSVIDVRGRKIGGNNFAVIAGPCSVESEEQIVKVAKAVKEAGAHFLRGGAFKPRTSPYSFKGLEKEGIRLLKIAREETGLPIVTELMDPRDIELFEDVDVIQIGARNMQNFRLLTEVGKFNKPVILKRGISATIEEWLLAAEYIAAGGTKEIILCERGIRTYETMTRNTFDISSIPLIKQLSHLPIISDPSHGTGRWDLVEPMAKASVAAGADGLIIEVHNNPQEALSDGPQSLKPQRFKKLMNDIRELSKLFNKKL